MKNQDKIIKELKEEFIKANFIRNNEPIFNVYKNDNYIYIGTYKLTYYISLEVIEVINKVRKKYNLNGVICGDDLIRLMEYKNEKDDNK